LSRNIDPYFKIQKNETNKNDLDLTQLFEGIKQRKAVSKKYKHKKSEIYDIKKNTIYCPLQVQDDTQIVQYGNWIKSIGQFIDLIGEASRMLPGNWQLVIREHPSCSVSFKRKLISLSNERFVIDNQSDSTEIISRAKAVITINSSVGFHALLKYKPVIVCGDAFWGFKPISHPVNNKSELFDKFSNINSLKSDIDAVKKYVDYLLKRKFILAKSTKRKHNINSNGIEIIRESMCKSLDYYRNK
jgi:capsular polysaccharide export protein